MIKENREEVISQFIVKYKRSLKRRNLHFPELFTAAHRILVKALSLLWVEIIENRINFYHRKNASNEERMLIMYFNRVSFFSCIGIMNYYFWSLLFFLGYVTLKSVKVSPFIIDWLADFTTNKWEGIVY